MAEIKFDRFREDPSLVRIYSPEDFALFAQRRTQRITGIVHDFSERKDLIEEAQTHGLRMEELFKNMKEGGHPWQRVHFNFASGVHAYEECFEIDSRGIQRTPEEKTLEAMVPPKILEFLANMTQILTPTMGCDPRECRLMINYLHPEKYHGHEETFSFAPGHMGSWLQGPDGNIPLGVNEAVMMIYNKPHMAPQNIDPQKLTEFPRVHLGIDF